MDIFEEGKSQKLSKLRKLYQRVCVFAGYEGDRVMGFPEVKTKAGILSMLESLKLGNMVYVSEDNKFLKHIDLKFKSLSELDLKLSVMGY